MIVGVLVMGWILIGGWNKVYATIDNKLKKE
jgi:hypothetical protein